MQFLRRNAIFIFFPAVLVAIVFLVRISFGTAFWFGEWGERSIVESTLLIAKEKIERMERQVRAADNHFFQLIDPTDLDESCTKWQDAIREAKLIKAALILDEFDEVVTLFHQEAKPERITPYFHEITDNILPLIDKYESLDRSKHLHRQVSDKYWLISYFSSIFRDRDFTTVLLYDTDYIKGALFDELLGTIGGGMVANVVDDHNAVIFGASMEGAGDFIVSRRFPTTLYKWRLQLAPTSAAEFASRAEAQRFSQAMLILLALGVIIFGLVVLYLSVVRERRINRLKSEFVSNVSHELKTPLSLIRMFGELFVMGRVTEESRAKRYHEIILKETERLTALIDNVLDFARIERGKDAYNFEKMDIAEVVERGIEIHRHRLEKQEVELQYVLPDNLPPARVDEHSITLAVANLVDNAIKYADGTDRILVQLGLSGSMIHIDVVDYGVGIPKNHLKRVFERFYRVPTKLSRKQRGSGIGLSLVHHIAETHGGKVAVTSEPGVETRFSVFIPAARRE